MLWVPPRSEVTLLCREYAVSYPETEALAAIPAGTIVGPITEVQTCVMKSRETERLVNEIHTQHADVKSSNELLEKLQESKGGVLQKGNHWPQGNLGSF